MTDKTAPAPASPVDLEQLVAEADIGGRNPAGVAAKAIMVVAVSWSLFQLWYASPLPFMVGFGVFSDTEARCFHLSFALFLAFASYPALASSPRDRVPLTDLALAAGAIACVLYLVVFYRALVLRPGLPSARLETVSVKAGGPRLQSLFDGSERLIAVTSLPWSIRRAFVPQAAGNVRDTTVRRVASNFNRPGVPHNDGKSTT
jgi:hypothetical protein